MRKYFWLWFLALILLLPFSAQALPDNLYFTLPNDTVKCINIVLPDDIDAILPGKIEYTLEMSPGPYQTWSDLSHQIVRTDENNTAVIPVCFRTFGKNPGDEAEPFTLTITAPGLPSRTVRGGVSVSGYPDMDTSQAQPGQNVSQIVNSQLDVFDMALKKRLQFASPGQAVTYILLLQSSANLNLDITARGNLTITPSSTTTALSSTHPRKEIALVITAPNKEGDYQFWITARIRGCSGSFCTKTVFGRLVVREEVPREAGWTVSLFPSNLNVKKLEPIKYTFTITNNGPAKTFSVDAAMPYGLETDFQPKALEVAAGSEGMVEFTATPTESMTLYELEVSATADGLIKSDSSYLATNEMLTDTLREAGDIKARADPETVDDINNALAKFSQAYGQKEYGEEIGDYARLQDVLSRAREKVQAPAPQLPGPGEIPAEQPAPETPAEGFNWSLIVIPMVIIAAVVGLLVYRKTRQERIEISLPQANLPSGRRTKLSYRAGPLPKPLFL